MRRSATAAEAAHRAGDLHNFFYGAVQHLYQRGIRGTVMHFPSVSAGDDQSAVLEEPQMVGDCRRTHIHQSREIGHTQFTVAENPEYLQPAGVAQLLHGIRNAGDLLRFRDMTDQGCGIVIMVMRENTGYGLGHCLPPCADQCTR